MLAQLGELDTLEARLSGILKGLRQEEADLVELNKEFKGILVDYSAKASEVKALALAAAASHPTALEEIKQSGERFSALQIDAQRLFAEAQRRHTRKALLSKSSNKTAHAHTKTNPADSYADDITSRLVELKSQMQDRLATSAANTETMERSARSVRALASKYQDFGTVSVESRRLVSKHAAKKRRDMLMMKAAVGLFGATCVFIFLKRLRVIMFVLRLLYRLVSWKVRGPVRAEHDEV